MRRRGDTGPLDDPVPAPDLAADEFQHIVATAAVALLILLVGAPGFELSVRSKNLVGLAGLTALDAPQIRERNISAWNWLETWKKAAVAIFGLNEKVRTDRINSVASRKLDCDRSDECFECPVDHAGAAS